MSNRTVTLQVEGMSCQHCQRTVENTLKALPGVSAAQVSLRQKAVTITFDPDRVTTDEMRQAIKEAGYEVGGN